MLHKHQSQNSAARRLSAIAAAIIPTQPPLGVTQNPPVMTGIQEQPPHGGEYRKHLPDISIPRFTAMRSQDAHEYAKVFKEGGNPPWLHALYLHWRKLFKEPYTGITTDGWFSQEPKQGFNTIGNAADGRRNCKTRLIPAG